MAATERPWNYEGAWIYGPSSEPISRPIRNSAEQESGDNALLIVRAVNNFDALKWALGQLLDSLGALCNPSELDGMGLSEEDQAKIIEAYRAAESK